MKRIAMMTVLLGTISLCSGCFFTKVVTVPMRVVGAVVSIVPVAGNTADTAIDKAADVVDELPF